MGGEERRFILLWEEWLELHSGLGFDNKERKEVENSKMSGPRDLV